MREKERERERERERAIANMRDLFRGSSTLTLRPRLKHYENFSLESIPPDHSEPQRLQGVHTRTIRLTSPSLVPAITTQASTLAGRGPTSTLSSHKNSKQHEPASSPPQDKIEHFGDLNTLIT